jgi:outer membrane protein OmpA-like peptidoglycan-associated protein
MAYNDNGQYRNLAEVPARPKNTPSFAEARATEAALEADRGGVAPSADKSEANPAPSARPEDRAPCGRGAGSARPAATLRFDRGSVKLPDDQRGVLSDALPEVRNGAGTIRVVGHGDSDMGSAQGTARFDLAMGRASAVAQALAEFGIPVQRIALQVACDENPAAGASVQLYAAS